MGSEPELLPLIEAVERELWKLDAEPLYAIALITGFDVETIKELGGL